MSGSPKITNRLPVSVAGVVETKQRGLGGVILLKLL